MIQRLLAFSCVAIILLGPVARADDKPAVPIGKFRGELVDPVKKDVLMKVALQTPQKLPKERHLGLLFLCHGYQGNEGNYIGLTVEALKRTGLAEQYVVISGKSEGPGWTVKDDARVLRVIAWAKEHYPIDARRVFIFGSSNGAAFTGRFASEHPEVFAGAIGYCGNYKFARAYEEMKDGAESRTEWYFVHGGKDNPQNSRRACDFLGKHGFRHVFRQMDGYGHTDIWDSRGHPNADAANAVRDDWLWWMHALRHKELAPSADELKALDTFVKAAADLNSDKAGPLLDEVARIGGPAAARAVLAALASKDSAVRARAAQSAEKTRYDGNVVKELVRRMADDPEAMVRKAAIAGLASAANWRDPEAQAALVGRARDLKAPEAERVLAASALGKCVKLALLGNFEDKLPVWTLVELLNDESGQVRAAAFAALEKGVPDTFGYKPDLPAAERKDALEKWRAWATQKCGPPPEKK